MNQYRRLLIYVFFSLYKYQIYWWNFCLKCLWPKIVIIDILYETIPKPTKKVGKDPWLLLAGDEVGMCWRLLPLRSGVLASRQQIGVNWSNFSAARPWISGCRIIGLWLGKKAVCGIKCRNINHNITSSQLRPIKVSKKDKVTVESWNK